MNNESSKRLRRPNVAVALFAVAVSALVISSDFYARRFWLDHPVTTGTLAALVGILVSVTVIEVILDRRSERRWRLLAQYALLELAEAAHGAWKILANVLGDEDLDNDEMADDPSRLLHILDSPVVGNSVDHSTTHRGPRRR